MDLSLVTAASIAFVLSLVLTWIVRQLSRGLGWVRGPISGRHVHTVPIPRLGGIAVFIAVIATALLLSSGHLSTKHLLPMVVPAGWMLLIGLLDDVRGLRARFKLAAQGLAGAVLFALGIRIPAPLVESEPLAFAVSLVLTVGWTITVLNGVNLIDGLDGLASGSTICITAGTLVLALAADDTQSAVFAAMTLGAIGGFLFFNAHPASIFLGDSGSLVIGTLITGLTIRVIAATPLGWLVCVLLLAHPFGELAISSCRRFLRSAPLFMPDRGHLHHRLLDRGLSHAQASVILVAISFIATLLALLTAMGGYTAIAAVLLGAAGVALGTVELRYAELTHFGRWLVSVPNQRKIIEAQVRLQELQSAIRGARSLTELRIALSEGFVAVGFESARLKIRTYDGSTLDGPLTQSSVGLSFPLHSATAKLGTLELSWNLNSNGWPFNPEFFGRELMPAITSKLEQFAHVYRELPPQVRPMRIPLPDLLPALSAEPSPLGRVQMHS